MLSAALIVMSLAIVKKNILYVTVTLGEIKNEEHIVGRGAIINNNAHSLPSVPLRARITDIISKVNTKDNQVLKYIPDKLLSEEQIESKKDAILETDDKRKKYKEEFRKYQKNRVTVAPGNPGQLTPRSPLFDDMIANSDENVNKIISIITCNNLTQYDEIVKSYVLGNYRTKKKLRIRRGADLTSKAYPLLVFSPPY